MTAETQAVMDVVKSLPGEYPTASQVLQTLAESYPGYRHWVPYDDEQLAAVETALKELERENRVRSLLDEGEYWETVE